MIIKASELREVNSRTDYGLGKVQDQIGHLVVRRTTPANPFVSQAHAGNRYWFVLEGQATVTVGDERGAVGPGDLIYVPEWTDNSLTTDSEVRWICFG
jgi:mannose-6-phosphate isomerase-like protein (cupin superfamily)